MDRIICCEKGGIVSHAVCTASKVFQMQSRREGWEGLECLQRRVAVVGQVVPLSQEAMHAATTASAYKYRCFATYHSARALLLALQDVTAVPVARCVRFSKGRTVLQTPSNAIVTQTYPDWHDFLCAV